MCLCNINLAKHKEREREINLRGLKKLTHEGRCSVRKEGCREIVCSGPPTVYSEQTHIYIYIYKDSSFKIQMGALHFGCLLNSNYYFNYKEKRNG